MQISIYEDDGALQTAREDFFNTLPHRPRCTEDYKKGTEHRDKEQAIQYPFIEHNQPYQINWLVLDVDHERPIAALYDAALPLPAWICQNRDNNRAHIAFGLIDPVCISPTAHSKPIEYYGAVYRGLRDAIGADLNYTGNITKNPLHSRFRTYWPRSKNGGQYTLAELASYVDTTILPAKPADEDIAALGRNCALFEMVRAWAYKAIRQGWPEYTRWHEAVRERAHALNQFDPPLPYPEVETVARSVAKFTHRQMNPAGFSAEQARRGQHGGRKSKGGGRPTNKASERQAQPWRDLGISKRTYQRRKADNRI